jgi:hypothetical protein
MSLESWSRRFRLRSAVTRACFLPQQNCKHEHVVRDMEIPSAKAAAFRQLESAIVSNEKGRGGGEEAIG